MSLSATPAAVKALLHLAVGLADLTLALSFKCSLASSPGVMTIRWMGLHPFVNFLFVVVGVGLASKEAFKRLSVAIAALSFMPANC